ncbi:MAG: putative oxidoreductase C-terminal domain-containing protein [Bacteroides sp.]|nr:putative oxidoreductase C-terminal domain-containing protein [Bacteroides sp.]
MKTTSLISALILPLLLVSCGNSSKKNPESQQTQNAETMFTPLEGKVKFMNLDPGHFHAALVQKKMYESVDPLVFVYAPEGPEVESYLNLIERYNTREENPTAWEENVYRGDDFFQKMIADKPGNVLVVSGNNGKKTEYILEAVNSGIHILSDKPMVITPEEFPMLEEAFATAKEKGVLLSDIMTERYEITTMMQKALSQIESVFGKLEKGSHENPAITKESVHHFSKIVSGNWLIRPPWFFDTEQQGEGIVDVNTHLVDLVQWEAFPGIILEKSDVEILSAKRWATELTPAMFEKVTGQKTYPDYLQKDVDGDVLKVYSNGEISYALKGVHAKVSVIWNFQAPEGSADTHYSIMRGTNCKLIIRQGEDEAYKPMLYIEPNKSVDRAVFETALNNAITLKIASKYPGVQARKVSHGTWVLDIPAQYKVGHEAHFGQVTEKYLGWLGQGMLPEWEIPNMIIKYYTTTEGMKKAME